MVVEDENYEYPPIELLSKPDKKKESKTEPEIRVSS